jgi:hypothetical protein
MNVRDLYGPSDGDGAFGRYCPYTGSQWGYPFRYQWSWPESPFVYTYNPPVMCGHINDPYCPNGQGMTGVNDIYGYPTCCCPRSGKCHTSAVVPVGDPPAAIVTWPLGPFSYLPGYQAPPF